MTRTAGWPGVAAVLVTHEDRATVARETLDHLTDHQVAPAVQLTAGAPAPWRIRRAVVRGVREAVEAGADGVLALEDDVRVRDDFGELFGMVLRSDYPTFLCTLNVNNIPLPWRVLADESTAYTVRPRVVPMARPQELFGAQAVYMPSWWVRSVLLTHTAAHNFSPTGDYRGMAFDSLLNALSTQRPYSAAYQVCIPDLVRHLSPPSVRNPDRHKRFEHMGDWSTE